MSKIGCVQSFSLHLLIYIYIYIFICSVQIICRFIISYFCTNNSCTSKKINPIYLYCTKSNTIKTKKGIDNSLFYFTCSNEHFKSNLSTFFYYKILIFILVEQSLTFHFSFWTFDRYKANVFSSKRERTYDMLLQDIYEKYIVDEHSMESYANTFGGSTSINKLYGNNRKLKDQKVSFSLYKKLFLRQKT